MLKNKIILITGSSRGIGKTTAELASNYGAHVIVHGKTKTPELEVFAKSIDAELVIFDATSKEEVRSALSVFERIDGVINCIGAPKVVPFLEASDEDWLDAYKTNFLGIVHICQEVLPKMQKINSGSIVNIASVRAYDLGTGVYSGPYCASKAALKNLSVSLAKQFAPTIRINSVSPGFTETDFSKSWNETVWKTANSSLLGRVGQPHEIGEMLCFLISDKASFITGQDFAIDGGLLASGIK